MTLTPDQKARMMTLEWAMDLIWDHTGTGHTGPDLARADLTIAALSLAQWVSGDRDPDAPALGASPDFDADELPTIEIPGEVYVGGRRADGILPDEPECDHCDVNDDGTHN